MLFQWASLLKQKYPELDLLFAIPNGAKTTWRRDKRGNRYSLEAIRLLKTGLKPGVPDVFLAVARKGYHGLFIEMKYGKNKPSDVQIKFIELLKKQGYLVKICYGFKESKQTISEYLDIKEL